MRYTRCSKDTIRISYHVMGPIFYQIGDQVSSAPLEKKMRIKPASMRKNNNNEVDVIFSTYHEKRFGMEQRASKNQSQIQFITRIT